MHVQGPRGVGEDEGIGKQMEGHSAIACCCFDQGIQRRQRDDVVGRALATLSDTNVTQTSRPKKPTN